MRETVYDQLLKLQKIPGAWEDWREYRKCLTAFLVSNTLSSSTALIIGAGACNDYDLVQLAEHFSKIYLLDLDIQNMEQALTNQVKRPELFSRFECIEGDVVGISSTQYRRFSSRLQGIVNLYGSAADINELSRIAVEEMEIGYRERETNEFLFKTDSVDYCITCGVHSQLNSMYPWIWEAYCRALKKTSSEVYLKAREFNNRFIPQFHKLLFQAARKGVLVAIEESRIGLSGGVEGSFQGIADLQERILSKKNTLKAEDSLLWPFNLREQILYSMKLMYVN